VGGPSRHVVIEVGEPLSNGGLVVPEVSPDPLALRAVALATPVVEGADGDAEELGRSTA
jgi:hypothetical protein